MKKKSFTHNIIGITPPITDPVFLELADSMKQEFLDLIEIDEDIISNDHTKTLKYITNWESYIRIKLGNYNAIQMKPQSSVLDISTGLGMFPYICKKHQHIVTSTDLDNCELYNKATEILDVNRHVHRIKKFKPFPNLGMFDYIVATQIMFNGHTSKHGWGGEEWEYFVDDIMKYLNDDGELWLFFNHEKRKTGKNTELFLPHIRDDVFNFNQGFGVVQIKKSKYK